VPLSAELIKKVNPYAKREANFAANRAKRERIDFDCFVE
jgi:hypothetical protein